MRWDQVGTEALVILTAMQAILTAALGYLGKAWLSRRMELERARLGALLERSVHIDKTRFDMELAIYRELWTALCNIRNAGWIVKRSGNSLNGTVAPTALTQAAASLQMLIERNRPFFAAEIAVLLFDLVDEFTWFRPADIPAEAADEDKSVGDILKNFPSAAEMTIRVRDIFSHIETIEQKTLHVCEAIRKRLTGQGLVH